MEQLAELAPGSVYWADLGESRGREQSGIRPYVVLSSHAHLAEVDSLVTVAPCTGKHRGWINHVLLTGDVAITRPTFVMTEQVRTVSRDRLLRWAGVADDACMRELTRWLRTWHVPN